MPDKVGVEYLSPLTRKSTSEPVLTVVVVGVVPEEFVFVLLPSPPHDESAALAARSIKLRQIIEITVASYQTARSATCIYKWRRFQ